MKTSTGITATPLCKLMQVKMERGKIKNKAA